MTSIDEKNLNIEVILINDGSEEDISQIIKTKWNFILKYYITKNNGSGFARNLGISKSAGNLYF